jgi:ATP-grasp ribosomal peptide maturase
LSSPDIILILTNILDPHADMVIPKLNSLKEKLLRYDTSNFPLESTITASYQNNIIEGIIQYGDRIIYTNQIKSIWYRRPSEFKFNSEMSQMERDFAREEARHGIGGILRSIECLWLNHPEKIVTAGFKPYQLKMAVDCGLQIPKTLITNSPQKVHTFFDECQGELIYKTLGNWSGQTENAGYAIMTNIVRQEDLDHLNHVTHTACLFQERVIKDFELRVTVVGKRIFCAEIHTPSSIVDWRTFPDGLTYNIHKLPDDLQDKLICLVQNLGLNFGAIDMIVKPTGEYIFLEINPNGQWGWIELETGLPISDAVADLLVAGGN